MFFRAIQVVFLLLVGIQGMSSCGLCRFYTFGKPETRTTIGLFYQFRNYQHYSRINPPPSIAYNFPINARISHKPLQEVIIDKSGRDFKSYTSVELRASLKIFENLQLGVILPYETNQIYFDRVITLDGTSIVFDSTLTYTGWSSAIGTIEYTLTLKKQGLTHFIRPLFGINFARRASQIVSSTGLQADHTIQPGAGLGQFFFRINYSMKFTGSGLNLSSMHGWSRENDPEYWYGESTHFTMSYYHSLGKNDFQILPEGGFTFEHLASDIEYNLPVTDTGSNSIFSFLALVFRYKNLQMTSSFHLPLDQNQKGSQLESRYRLASMITYLF